MTNGKVTGADSASKSGPAKAPFHAVLVTSYPFPGVGATANRVRALAEAVAALPGAQVTVVGPGPDDASASVDLKALPYAVRSKPEGAYSRRNLVQRALREIRQSWRLLREAQRCDADAMAVTSPSVFLLAAGLFERRKPVVIDLRDLVWEYFVERGGVLGYAGRVLRLFSLMCLRRASAMTVTNDHEANSLIERGLERPLVVRNGIDEVRFRVLERIAQAGLRQECGPLQVLYVGNVGLAQGLGTLVRAVHGLVDVQVTIVGGGADFDRVEALVGELQADNVTLTGPLSWENLPDYYRDADVMYAQVGEAYGTAVPSKLFEYLATGRKVIFGGPEGSAAELLRSFEQVSLVPPDDAASLREAIQSAAANRFPGPIYANVRKVGEEHLRESQAERFADVIERLAGQA